MHKDKISGWTFMKNKLNIHQNHIWLFSKLKAWRKSQPMVCYIRKLIPNIELEGKSSRSSVLWLVI